MKEIYLRVRFGVGRHGDEGVKDTFLGKAVDHHAETFALALRDYITEHGAREALMAHNDRRRDTPRGAPLVMVGDRLSIAVIERGDLSRGAASEYDIGEEGSGGEDGLVPGGGVAHAGAL